MALPLSNNFETGLADETAITTANSDDGSAGNAFDNVVAGSGSIVFDTARAAHGTLSGRFAETGATNCYVNYTSGSLGTLTEIYGRVYLYRTAAPSDHQYLVRLDGGTTNALITNYQDGKIYTYIDGFSSPQGMTNSLPLNEWARVEWHIITNTTTGLIEVKMFSGDSSSPTETMTRSNVNTGTNFDTLALGNGAATACETFWLDDIALNGTGYPGPAAGAGSGMTQRMTLLGVS